MRALCDVCEAAAAEMFCTADEAAVCAACDDKVHGCNKLASRHVRLKLAESRAVPKCDICENGPAFFYCGVDGTSLCLQCDMDVHVGGKKAHERFLLMAQRIELPEPQGEGEHQVNGMDMDRPAAPNGTQNEWHAATLNGTRPVMNGTHGAADQGENDYPLRKRADGHPPSSTAATAPGRDSLAAGVQDPSKARQQSVAKAASDAPAVAIAVGDEVEGGIRGNATETGVGGAAACEAVLRDSPGAAGGGGVPEENRNTLSGIRPKIGWLDEKDRPSFDLNLKPRKSPQSRRLHSGTQDSDELSQRDSFGSPPFGGPKGPEETQ